MKLTNPDLITAISSEWKGARDGRGRPMVPDDVLTRMELVTTEMVRDFRQWKARRIG